MVALAVVSGLETDFRTVPAGGGSSTIWITRSEILIGRNAGHTLFGICFLDNQPNRPIEVR